MEITKAHYEIIGGSNQLGIDMLKDIEAAGRTCYKSEDKITDESALKFVAGLIKRGHEAMLEHASFSVRFICDRGVSHELVRHRIASFAQESTRYCNYKGGVTFIEPCFWSKDSDEYAWWEEAMESAEQTYLHLINEGATPQEARSVLPNSVKTEIVVTMNLREWRHFFKLRACGTTGKPHPQMLELTIPLLKDMKKLIPVVFDDLEVKI